MLNKKNILVGLLIILVIIFLVLIIRTKNNKNEVINEIDEKISKQKEIKISNIEKISKNVTMQELIENNYFVYNCNEKRVYNKQKLDKFITNTSKEAENRISDEINIAIYTINDEPTIYNISYDKELNRYFYIKDNTRILTYEPKDDFDILKTEITYQDDIPGEYYELIVKEEKGLMVNIIQFKASGNLDKYKDIEVGRFLSDV